MQASRAAKGAGIPQAYCCGYCGQIDGPCLRCSCRWRCIWVFTDEKLVALLVMLGSITTPACYVMAKQMGHEGVLTGSVCVTTTLFQRIQPDLLAIRAAEPRIYFITSFA